MWKYTERKQKLCSYDRDRRLTRRRAQCTSAVPFVLLAAEINSRRYHDGAFVQNNLRPVTKQAIFSYAAILLLVGTALRTFLNLETE